MAYASVASLLETIHLVNYHGDSSISSRFKDRITSLHQHATFLQSFLEDDPKRAENWEETIRDVADRAEEIIDLLVSDSLRKSEEVNGGFDELERVTVEMESTADRVKGRGTKAKVEPDEELMKIVSLLREGSSNREAIAIVGMGGTGRSTLARNAYNHPLVMEHFDVRAWSTISQEYSGRDIIRDLLRCINIESFSYTEDVDSLYRSLYGRRYLIVLQNIWSVDAWDEVRRAFPENENGGRIIVTTRLYDLAATIDAHVHEMRLLDGDSAWNLLREKIFNGDPCPFQLEHFGKMIAKSCRGHPLSIEVVSGILAADQTKAAWEDVSENIEIASEEDDYAFSVILSLSYTYLPHYLRPCFLYLGCFTEHNEIRVSKLIKLWVAEGFLTQSETKTFQETGEEHVEVLVRRSLVSVSKRKSNGRIKSITVHDLVRDLCLRQAQIGNFFNNVGSFDRFDELHPCRRVSSSNNSHDFLKRAHASTIRTVILQGEVGVRWSMRNARLLRILDLSNAPDYDLPVEIFELFHLRYLAFHFGFNISEAISNLQNLQTLIICPRENGRKLVKLPEGIWRMPQLRHLLSLSLNLPPLNQGEGENSALENLETLSRVVDFVCSRENLKLIPNVKKLTLVYTNELRKQNLKMIPSLKRLSLLCTKKLNVVVEDYELQNLISLHKLEILKIEIDWPLYVEKLNKMSYAFPPMLKKLNLCGSIILWEDMKIVGSLPNLEVLKLRNYACVGGTWKTSEGGFSRLTYLKIEGSDLEEWITKSSHFPRLKSLVLRMCLYLLEVPCEIGEIPTLELLELDCKNEFLVNSAKQIQEDRERLGDELLQVLVIE